MQKQHYFIAFTALFMSLVACKQESNFDYYYYTEADYSLLKQYVNLPEIPFDYKPTTIQNGNVIVSGANTVNSDQATLGRVLFYDKKLSKDGKISCASCHKQELAFGDDQAVSKGVYDRQGDRNSISLLSVTSFAGQYGGGSDFGGGGKRFFWDNRAATAAEQAIGSMQNPKEMDMHETDIIEAVQNQPYYKPLFTKAYGDAVVTKDRVTQAIANFVNAMGSAQSRFDVAKGDKFDIISSFSTFTAQENQGKSLYAVHCSNCHGDISSVSLDHASNGLDETPTDRGVGGFTGFSQEDGTFKVPSLRNITLTAPYMHDGRFKTLDAVFDHYASGVKNHVNLHPNLRDAAGNPKRIQLSSDERAAMVAFFNTLKDDKALTDVRFSNPYKQ